MEHKIGCIQHDCDKCKAIQQNLALKDLEIMRLREALIYHTQQTRPIHQTEQALSTPINYDDLMAWHDAQLGAPVAWLVFDGEGHQISYESLCNSDIPLYAKKG